MDTIQLAVVCASLSVNATVELSPLNVCDAITVKSLPAVVQAAES